MTGLTQNQLAKDLLYYMKILCLYGITIAIGWFAFSPFTRVDNLQASALKSTSQKPFLPVRPKVAVVSGMPVKITMPDSSWNGQSVDLKVIPGYYDASSNSWTLSGYDAQFDMTSVLPNTYSGQSFIYGHNNDYVFGALRHNTPSVGDPAFVYTSNNHIFEYKFMSSQNLGPTDTSILDYSGPPTLLVQTCTGSLNQWRTEYKYQFYKLVQ